jgi:cytochrome bd-type quinol oxidase subunit 2
MTQTKISTLSNNNLLHETAKWWSKRWLGYTITLVLVATFSYLMLQLVSQNGAPHFFHLVAFLLISQFGYLLMFMLSYSIVIKSEQQENKVEAVSAGLYHYLLRLLAGIALFPLICVLFLNRSKF